MTTLIASRFWSLLLSLSGWIKTGRASDPTTWAVSEFVPVPLSVTTAGGWNPSSPVKGVFVIRMKLLLLFAEGAMWLRTSSVIVPNRHRVRITPQRLLCLKKRSKLQTVNKVNVQQRIGCLRLHGSYYFVLNNALPTKTPTDFDKYVTGAYYFTRTMTVTNLLTPTITYKHNDDFELYVTIDRFYKANATLPAKTPTDFI